METANAIYEVMEPGLVQITMKDGPELDMEALLENIEALKQFANGGRLKILVITGTVPSSTPEVREYISSQAVNDLIQAEAIVFSNLALRLIVDSYIRLERKHRPAKAFDSAEKAIAWLKALD